MKGVFKTTAQGPDSAEVGLRYEQHIPFVPPIGMMVTPVPGGALMEVEGLMWDAARPMEVELYVYDPAGLDSVENMTLQGWARELL